MTPALPSGVPSTAMAFSNEAPAGFQNSTFSFDGSAAMDGTCRVRINGRRKYERGCRSLEWRPCTTTSTPSSPHSKKCRSASNLRVRHDTYGIREHAILEDNGITL